MFGLSEDTDVERSDLLRGNGRFIKRFSNDSPGDGEADGRNPGIGKSESIIAYGAAIAATFLVRRALSLTWQATLNRDPPKNPASHAVAWKDALLWGAISGAVVGMTRIGSRRASTAVYRSYRSR